MITKKQIKIAIQMLTLETHYMFCSEIETQILNSLRIYLDRGEFDYTLESAINCLKLAEYEIKGIK